MKFQYTHLSLLILALVVLAVGQSFVSFVLAEATSVLRPIADGGNDSADWDNHSGTPCNSANCYIEVDESSCDEDTSFVESSINGATQTFNLDISDITDSYIITQIDVTVCASRQDGGAKIQTRYCIDGSCSNSGTNISLGSSYKETTQSFTGLSLTGGASTDLEIGVLNSAAKQSRVSRVSAVITYTATPPPDATAPAAVTDLAVSNSTASSVDLSWTAPGDDNNIGTATTYDVRYSTSKINNENNWNSATQASGEPAPQIAGTAQSMTVSGLAADTTYYFAIKTSDEVPNESSLSNVVSATTAAATDTTAPSAVSDLVASNPTTSSITLTWTSPGDDESSGTAATYDVRYRTNTINSGNWNSATQASGEPTPQIAGTAQSMTVSGLAADTTYYFAIKTSDEVPNESSLSNVVSATTAAAFGPSADLSITKLDNPDPVVAGDTLTYTVTITNNGSDDAENVVVSDTLPLALTSPSINSSQGACAGFPCNLGAIASGHSASITIISPIDSGTTGTITNIASVSSDTDDPATSNNASTQETAVSSPSSPSPPSSPLVGGVPTIVVFSGKAFPGARIFVVDKNVRFETTVGQNIIVDEDGSFRVDFVGVSQRLHSFGLLIKDKDNRATQTKFFNIDVAANDLVVKDILVPPTIGFPQRRISRGQLLLIAGSASPNNSVILEIDGTIKKEVSVEKNGSYRVAIDTGILEFGTHYARVKQVDSSQGRESDYSLTNAFVVSRLIQPKTDLNSDGAVDIKDWSMFLSGWVSKDESQKKMVDFNEDGKINISDFSIFIRTIKK